METTLEILYDFNGSEDDPWQLKCSAGTILVLQKEYDDGWSYVRNPETRKQGIVPTAWMRKVDESFECEEALETKEDLESKEDIAASCQASSQQEFDYSKYRRMEKAGLPEGAIINAMNRDGVQIPADFFRSKDTDTASKQTEGCCKLGQEYEKYVRMKKAGIPMGAIANAMERDGVTVPANFFGETEVKDKSTPKARDKKYEKYEKMKKAGLPEGAILNAMKRDGVQIPDDWDCEGSIVEKKPEERDTVLQDPKYSKYAKMKKAGLPIGAIQNAMKRDGVECPANWLNEDSQSCTETVASTPDPKFQKYERMKVARVPEGAILNAMKRDGISPPPGFFKSSLAADQKSRSTKIGTSKDTKSVAPTAGFLDGIKSFDKTNLQKAKSSDNAKKVTKGTSILDGIKGFDRGALKTAAVGKPKQKTSSAKNTSGNSLMDLIQAKAQERQKRSTSNSSILSLERSKSSKSVSSPSQFSMKNLKKISSNKVIPASAATKTESKPAWMQVKLKSTPSAKNLAS